MTAQTAVPLAVRGTSVLVTGATGKVGRRLVGALMAEQARVTILTRHPEQTLDLWPGAPVICRQADLTHASSLGAALDGIECVFHLASYSPAASDGDIYEASGHWPVTAEGTRNLVVAAVAAGVRRLIYLSSVKAMGDAAGAGPTPASEDTPAEPDSLYGRAKLAAEGYVLDFGAHADRHASVLRLPMVYGLRDQGNIARMIDAIARNRFPPWPKVTNRRSAIHVDDAVQAALLAAAHPRAKGQIFLVTDGCEYSTRWLYEQIRLALGRRVPSWTIPLWALSTVASVGTLIEQVSGRAMPLTRTGLNKLTGNAWFSAEKIRRELGFIPRHRLAEEIPRLVTAYLAG
ncbi:MAG: NAD-dependent epimerase/dehydratase family protein [Chromatiaceae bacterium]|jgi:nucleoside-diphosphate-sugar epimerase|nr:NAD-dependent epimerase/dehydratase family protein [Chromatiaceae bacterium]